MRAVFRSLGLLLLLLFAVNGSPAWAQPAPVQPAPAPEAPPPNTFLPGELVADATEEAVASRAALPPSSRRR